MSDLVQELPIKEVDVKENVVWWSRSMSDLERELQAQQALLKEEVMYREQVIEYHENEMKKLNNNLTKELLILRNDLTDGFENLKKLIQQQAPAPTERSGVTMSATADVHSDENSDVAALKLSIASDVDTLAWRLAEANQTITGYKQKLKGRDEVVESMQNELKTLNESIAISNVGMCHLHEQIANLKLENCDLMLRSESKDEEIKNLKDLLKLADRKLEERLQQMEQMTSSMEQLTELITDVKVSETRQKEVVYSVVGSMQTLMSSWTEVMDRLKHTSARKTIKSIFAKTDLPGYLTRLAELYPRMTEKLSATSVAAELFQNDVLTLAELQKVQFSRTPIEAAEYLLNRILDMHSKVSYDCFLSALKATNQEHLFLWLNYDDYDIESQHTDLICKSYTFLLDHLNPNVTGLTSKLFQLQVIDQREREFLESGDGAVCQAERLLSALSRKSVEQFERFLVALDQTGHEVVANELRGQQYVASSAAVAENSVYRNFLSSEPLTGTICHVIAASDGRTGGVGDLTEHGNELFLVRSSPTFGRIEVYDPTTFKFQRFIEVIDLGTYSYGLTSCEHSSCLYVSDWGNCVVRKMELNDDNEVTRRDFWKTTGWPSYLLVNSRHNVMVTCRHLHVKLIEYQPNGQLVREIRLHDDVWIVAPAVQLNGLDSGSYRLLIISRDRDTYGPRVMGLVDADGRVLRSYGDKCGELNITENPAADDRSVCLFVADDSVLVFDSVRNSSCDLEIDGTLKKPFSLYFDKRRNRLLVGENNGTDSRVVFVRV